MVARALKLRFLIIAATFTNYKKAAKTVFACLAAAGVTIATAWFTHAQFLNPETAWLLDSIITAAVLFGLTVVPFLIADKTLSPAQFAHTNFSSLQIVWAVFIAWPFNIWGFTTTLFFVSRCVYKLLSADYLYVGASDFLGLIVKDFNPALPIIEALLLLLFAQVISFATAIFGQWFFKHIPSARLRLALSFTLALLLLPLFVFLLWESFRGNKSIVAGFLQTLKTTPFGLQIAFSSLGFQDVPAEYFIAFITATVICLIALAVAFKLAIKILFSNAKPKPELVRGNSLGWFDSFADTPAGAIAARTMIYWRYDPRYRAALWAIPVAALFTAAAFAIAGGSLNTLILVPGPIMMFLLGWSVHNDVAMDSTAIWLHVAAGVRGIDDRIGRLAPVAIIGIPVAILISVVSVVTVQQWYIFVTVLCLNIALLAVGSAVSAIASAWTVYPSTRPGESVFLQPQFTDTTGTAAQIISFIMGLVLALPAIITSVIALNDRSDFAKALIAQITSLSSGAIILTAAIFLGGLIFDRSAAEIVRVTEVYD